jgi:uncharacterized protein YndB with AHSA1/START domain
MSELCIESSIEIAAPASRVWKVLTEPELTRQYMFGCDARSDWKVGSTLLWDTTIEGKKVTAVKGSVVAIEPHRLLQYTVIDPNGDLADVPENYLTVTCRLTEQEGATRLDITQGDYSRVADGRKRYEHAIGSGWDSILGKLKAVAEQR